jgi:hypothetical protein
MRQGDIRQLHYGLIAVRKIMSLPATAGYYIQSVIDTGIVPQLVELVKQQEYPFL